MALLKTLVFYCRYFCYFPPHWFWSGLAWNRSCTPIGSVIVMGALIIILGLHQMEVFHFHFLEKQKSVDFGANKQKNELFSAFLLGLGFSFGWTPCIGPVLGSVLALAASRWARCSYGSYLSPCLYLGNGPSVFTVGT